MNIPGAAHLKPPPGLNQNEIIPNNKQLRQQIILTSISTLITAATIIITTYSITHVNQYELITSITSQLRIALFIMLIQSIWIAVLSLQALLITQPYIRIIPSLAVFSIFAINPHYSGSTILISIICAGTIAYFLNSMHSYQEYFRKISFRLLIPTHAQYLNIATALLMALSIYLHINTDTLQTSLNSLLNNTTNLIAPRLLNQLTTNTNNDINQYIPEELKELDIDLSQLKSIITPETQDSLSQQITQNTTNTLTQIIRPIMPYLHPTISIIAFITILQILNLFTGIACIITNIIMHVSKGLGLIRINIQDKPIEILEFTS